MKQRLSSWFPLILIILTISGALVFIPKISSQFIPDEQQTMLDSFMRFRKTTKTVNPEAFWEFREFYSPGSFEFEKNGFQKNRFEELTKHTTIKLVKDVTIFPFLLFHSPKIDSIEALTPEPTLKTLIESDSYNHKKDCLINSATELLCLKGSEYHMIFIKPLSELKKTNGFYDYQTDEVKQLVKDKYWLVLAIIKK